jgi:hypothetical protein
MSKKLYIYSAILAIIYVVFFGNCVYEIVDSGIGGVRFGMREAEKGNLLSGTPYEILGAHITPSAGTASFPSTILNEKTGENIRLEVREVLAFLTQLPDPVPVHIKILKFLNFILNFCLLGLFIYLPFIAYKVMKSISKDEFYTIKNINNIRKIAIVVLSMFIIITFDYISMNIVSGFYMQLEGYKFVIRDINFPVLFVGLVVLILSEILRYTTTMKEEQEFTI